MKKKILYNVIYSVSVVVYIGLYVLFNLIIDILHLRISWGAIFITLLPLTIWILLILNFFGKLLNMSKFALINVIIIGVLICSISWFKLGYYEWKSHFDYNTWVSNHEERSYMVRSLLNQHELKGLSHEQVLELIGAPDKPVTPQGPQDKYVYQMGRAGLGVDDELLIIEFELDKVSEYGIVQD